MFVIAYVTLLKVEHVMSRTQTYYSRATLFYIVLAVIFVYIVFPFYWAFRSSITPDSELFVTPVHYWPDAADAGALSAGAERRPVPAWRCATRPSWRRRSTLLSLFIGTVGAYALGRFRFRGRLPVMYLILSMTMFPSIAILGSLFDLVRRFGLYNNLLALVITYLVFTLPFTVWVLTSFFQSLPKELEEAAYVDGARRWRRSTR